MQSAFSGKGNGNRLFYRRADSFLYVLLLIEHCHSHTDFKHETKFGSAFVLTEFFLPENKKCGLCQVLKCNLVFPIN